MLPAQSRRRLSWAFAALMVVALPGVKSTFAASSAQMLSSQLPAGVSLKKATVSQTAAALHEAVAKDQADAVSLLDAAVMSKMKNGGLSCGGLRSLVDAAKSSAPDKARELTEAAMAMKPDCGEALSQGVGASGSGILGDVGSAPTQEAQGFGAGLGAGFPGSPGFIGSAPSGAFAGFAPIVVLPVTSTTNQ